MGRTPRAKLWTARLRSARNAWARLRPNETLTSRHSGSGQFSFSSAETIAEGIRFGTGVHALQIGDAQAAIGGSMGIPFGADISGLRTGDVSIRMWGRFFDACVISLLSSAENRDIGDVYFLDFDVHAVHCILEGRTMDPWPHVELDALDEEITSVLQTYCDKIDRIWDRFGGRSQAGFEMLALWTIEQDRKAGAHANALGAAFAAFLYGDTGLAQKLLADLEASWDQRLRQEPGRPIVAEMRLKVLESIQRARKTIG